MEIKIQGMLLRHIDEIYEIECENFSTPWSVQTLVDDLSNPLAQYFVLEVDGRVVAYLGVRTVIDEVHIMNIAVSNEEKGRGYGSMLMDELMTFCAQGVYREITLEVRESNAPAIKLYEKYGFEKCGMRSNYYEKPVENALLMIKYL